MFKYSESVRGQFKNYHLKNNRLLTVFLDASGNTVIRVYAAKTFALKNEVNLNCKTFNIFFYPGEDVLAYFPLQRLTRVDLQTGKIQTLEGVKFAPELLIDDNLFGISIDEFSNKILGRMSLVSNEQRTLIKEPFRLWGSSAKDIYGVKIGKGQEVYSINSHTGSVNWNYNFGTDLSGKILSYNELVLIFGHSILFGVNSKDGSIVWKNESINSLINLYKNKLVNVTASDYREVSPGTGETLLEYEMESEYEKHGFMVTGPLGAFTVTDSHIFIVHAMGCRVGCINRSTGKIDWSVAVGEGKVTLPHAPIIYEDKLYILDDEGTLHVYQKE